jgi:threonine dehydrogenase-like Zn-dependent dehydrogenase
MQPIVANAAILHGAGDIRTERRELPPLGASEVLLDDLRASVCGTDSAKYRGEESIDGPVWLGHEFGGRVAAVGDAVKDLAIGQTVAAWVSPTWPYGGFADRTIVEARYLVPMQDRALAWAVEPLMCAVRAVLRSNPPAGPLQGGANPLEHWGYQPRRHRTIAVIGTGAMGLFAAALSMLEQPARLTIIGRSDEGLGRARRLLEPMKAAGTELAFAKGDHPALHHGADVVYEAIGIQATLDTADRLVRMGGDLSVMGFHQSGGGTRTINVGDLLGWRAVSLHTGHSRDAETAGLPPEEDQLMPAMRLAASLLNDRTITPIAITAPRVYPIADVAAAFAAAAERGTGKVIIDSTVR